MIVISKLDNTAIFCDAVSVTGDRVIGNGWVSKDWNSTTCHLVDLPKPDPWIGGGYTLVNGELVINAFGSANIPSPTMPELADYDKALTAHLDSVAQSRNWQDRISLMSRAGFPGPWQADAVAFGQWADGCNVIGYQMLADYQNGVIPQPTIAEVLAALPPMVWPA